MLRAFVYGALLGGAGVYFDVHVSRGLIGLSFPLAGLFLIFLCIVSVFGLSQIENKSWAISTAAGILGGLLGFDYARTVFSSAESVFSGLTG